MVKFINKNGFTFIELILLIVIIGVLMAVAAPKFISVDKEATIASLKTVKGTIASAFTGFQTKTYMPSAEISIKEVDGIARQYLIVNKQEIEFTQKDRKPRFSWFLDEKVSLQQLQSLVDANLSLVNEGGDFFVSYKCSANGGFYILPKTNTEFLDGCDTYGKQCFIRYRASENSDNVELTLVTDDC